MLGIIMLGIIVNFSFAFFVLKLIKKKIMKEKKFIKLVMMIFIVYSFFYVQDLSAQALKNSGPRFGITVVGPGLLSDILNDNREIGDEKEVDYSQKEAIMTQIGWQWETILKEGSEFSGIIEWVGFVGGLERGTIVPSFSGLLGIRKNSGFEIAMGPTASLTGIGLVVAAGHTFKSGDLNVPVNIAFVPSRENHFLGDPASGEKKDSGFGFTLTVGFNFNNPK